MHEGVRVVGEAADGDGAVRLWRETSPDVVVLDMRMPGMSGLDAARQMLAETPSQVIIMCSASMEPRDRHEAQRLGVSAYVDKDDMADLGTVVLAAYEARQDHAATTGCGRVMHDDHIHSVKVIDLMPRALCGAGVIVTRVPGRFADLPNGCDRCRSELASG
jgi:CheY-like chemotaxis protein